LENYETDAKNKKLESRHAGKPKEQEGTAQGVEAGTGILRRVQGHCPVV